ncbi:hypothetical protein AB0K18_40590 [Nonomuraea sp. NPDC049421]|uniref:hypothetical protein n=1 Tax=Nonomuraea sp. NPDC049421 TaxID=3155275 RepID=UPI00341A5A16
MSQAPHLTLRNVTLEAGDPAAPVTVLWGVDLDVPVLPPGRPAARSRRHVWSLLRGEVAAARE